MATTLRQRHVGERKSSMWEQEADEYWKEMEPSKRCKKISGYIGGVVLGLMVVGGTAMTMRHAWHHMPSLELAALKNRFFPLPTVDVPPVNETTTSSVQEPSTVVTSDGTPTQAAKKPTTAVEEIKRNVALESNPAAIDVLRARCRVRGVQTRWHEETCRKYCLRDPLNAACMNGCSYGSITVTKLTCDQMAIQAVPSASTCPDGVNCVAACKVYDTEQPFPDTRNTCERACSYIVPDSCNRVLQIYKDLYRASATT